MNYFFFFSSCRSVIEHTRSQDPANRPVTFVSDVVFEKDRVVSISFEQKEKKM